MNSFVELCWNIPPRNWLLFCTQKLLRRCTDAAKLCCMTQKKIKKNANTLQQEILIIWRSEGVICKESRDLGCQKLQFEPGKGFWLCMRISAIKQGIIARRSDVRWQVYSFKFPCERRVETWILPCEIDMLVNDSDYHACGSPSYAFPVTAAEIMRQRTLFGLAVIMFY